MSGWLQIVVLVQVFAIGFVSAWLARHAYHYFRPHHQDLPDVVPNQFLTADAKEHLMHDAQSHMQAVVKQSAAELQHELGASTNQINTLVQQFASEIVESEMERYRAELDKLRGQANSDMAAVNEQMAKYQQELRAKMAEDINAEKQQLIKQMDNQLAEAVGSFLIETLGHNVDLGSQSSYLVQMLEEHKDEFKKEVADEPKAAQ